MDPNGLGVGLQLRPSVIPVATPLGPEEELWVLEFDVHAINLKTVYLPGLPKETS